MLNREEAIEQVNVNIDAAKEAIDLRDALFRLRENKDWKTLIDQGYFEFEAQRLVLVKADDNMQDEVQQASLDRQIMAVGTFRNYLRKVTQIGNIMEKTLIDSQEARQELESMSDKEYDVDQGAVGIE